ncbi:MAG: HAMP domain-containing histidine kinase [Planctomyces sp.]|nr:HAMP domain-containing histidine kinase [Planctomyces sp.]
MFLVRTIRRRMVSGFAIALVLMLVLSGAGIMGLIWHQEAVSELAFVLYESPNRDQLSKSLNEVGLELFQAGSLREPQEVSRLQSVFRNRINSAMEELSTFRERVEQLQQTPQLLQQRNHVLGRLDVISAELGRMFSLSQQLKPIQNEAEQRHFEAVRTATMMSIVRTQRLLDNLPAYHEHQHWIQLSLAKERKRSETLLKFIVIATVSTIAIFAGTIVLGFRWISVPLRTVAKGAIRIANGDTSYRLQSCSRWQDEFTDLVRGVNYMADRFEQAEQELQAKVAERSEQLVRSQRLVNVGFLAAGVAHEVNNPLSAISLAADSLQMRLYDCIDLNSQDGKEIMERVSMIRSESRRCGEITRRLLDFSRGGEKGEKTPDDLVRIIREVLIMVRHLGRFGNRTVEFDRMEPLMVEVNSAQMKQVILNVVANSLQATKDGGHVRIEVTEQLDSVNIIITDNGCGMDAETLHHIFDPFFSTKETGQGTGLGLSITHRIVEDHAGTIVPSSPGPGLGSTFRIRLPRRQMAAAAA